jgi:hypothetical protein
MTRITTDLGPPDIRIDLFQELSDGKQTMTLEVYLALCVERPQSTQETLRMNTATLLRLLGVVPTGKHETKRAAAWLRANAFRAGQRGKIWKVKLVHAHACQYCIT